MLGVRLMGGHSQQGDARWLEGHFELRPGDFFSGTGGGRGPKTHVRVEPEDILS